MATRDLHNNIGGGWLTGRSKAQGVNQGKHDQAEPSAFAVAVRILRRSKE